MNSDRPLYDEKLLEELAALDALLRQPVKPAPPPVKPPSDIKATAPVHSFNRAVPSFDRVESSRNLAVASSQTEALRAHAEPPESISRVAERGLRVVEAPLSSAAVVLSSRPFRLGVLWLGALGVGLLIGWNAVHFIVPTLTPEPTTLARPAAVPVTKAPGTSLSKRPALPPSARRPAAAAPSVRESNIVAPPAAALSDASAIVTAIPSAPAPSIDVPPTAVPLPAAPLPVTPSVTPAAPPARAAAGALAAAVASDEAAIETALRQYEDAYERLDAKAAVAVWPTVDQRALSRAFAGLASQDLVFRGCEVVVRAGASTATASCRGTAEYVQKVGNARPHVEPREWLFTLNKTQGEWRIETVDGRR